MLKRIASRVETARGLTVGRRLSSVAFLLCIVLGTVLGVVGARQYTLPWAAAFGLFSSGIILGLLGAQFFYELEGWLEQRGRDLEAAKIYSALRAGRPSPRPFTLYLRPFASTDEIGTDHDRLVPMRPVAGGPSVLALATDRLEFEAEVEKALRPIGPLLALGQPLEHMGAGRIRVDDDEWRAAVARLMDAATLIVLLPSSRPGTTWEVKTLLSGGRLVKTIVVDPPDELGVPDSDYDPSEEWAEVRRAFAAEGFTLPPDDPEGLLLYFGNANTPTRSTKISIHGESSVRAFAAGVLNEIAALPASPAA